MKKGVKNKKGLQLAVSTIIIIILGILVLVGLLFLWNQQTGVFSDFLGNIVGKTNVDAVVVSCNALYNQQSFYDFCCVKREVRYELNGKIEKEKISCLEFSEKDIGARVEKLNCENAGC